MAILTLACQAMATRFELVLHGDNPVSLRAAGEEALEEIERLEDQLSLYRPSSEIAHLNARAALEPVRVSPSLFGVLEHAQRLHDETAGAFDITIAPLVRCWGFMGGNGRMPTSEDVVAARAKVGMHLVQLHRADLTVSFRREGVMLDLGAFGKGYAVGRAIELLRENGVTSALLHGGTSTVYALGQPQDAEFWTVAVPNPKKDAHQPSIAKVPLQDEALSVSDARGRFFQVEGRSFGHVLDPRSGEPTGAGVLAAVAVPSAAESDALSTALLISGSAGHAGIARLRPGMRTLLVTQAGNDCCVESQGMKMEVAARF
jgi:thiamine biosynthesis lipoprotein